MSLAMDRSPPRKFRRKSDRSSELDRLTANLTERQVEELVDRMGLTELTRQLPPVLRKLVLAAQRLARDNPPIPVRVFLSVLIYATDHPSSPPTPPPASPEPPTTPVRPRAARSTPTTPQTSGYIVSSPSKVGVTATWFEAGALTQGVPGSSVRGQGKTRLRRKSPAGAYTVFYGGEVGVFEKWDDVQRSISGHDVAIHASFPSIATADAALEFARSKGWTADSTPPSTATVSPLPLPSSYDDNPLNLTSTASLWYAICRGVVPGVYRSWLECGLNTIGVKGNLCSSFASREAAETAFTQASKNGWVSALSRPLSSPL
ncbi:hypothetical protein B0H10DRAFT_2216701 [Mycena sp. CBHHK59/15]|nr:hypothetical protein B0H10DRAFT_2216701 [Mycena sp. CBHHK59/15]